MFGFSVGKLLVFVILCVAGWIVATRLRRIGQKPKTPEKHQQDQQEQGNPAIDLIACQRCGRYFPKDSTAIDCHQVQCPVRQ